MKNTLLVHFILLLFTVSAFSQEERHNCIPESLQKKLYKQVKENEKRLIEEGKLSINKSAIVLFDWPLQQASGFNYNNYYCITNYVDHDPSTGILDYMGGGRTYNGHNGIDISLAPFDWNMVQNSQVEVIAAATGMIVGKDDGHSDQSCSLTTPAPPVNYIMVKHADGSTACYLHMKNGSVTTKPIGSTVVAGEYLGIVASSGYSTGPHLHFEVWDANNNVIDPYAGPFNNMNSASWWANQKPYEEPTINHIQTNDQLIDWKNCPNTHIINNEDYYLQGDQICFSPFYQDMLSSITQNYKVYQPNGTIWLQWTHTESLSYVCSRGYEFCNTLPSNAMIGTWTFEVNFNGQTVTHDFYVTGLTPNLECANQGSLNINTNSIALSGFQVENSGNGSAAASTLAYYLSPNTTINNSDYLAGTDPVGALNAGATSNEGITITPNNIANMPPDGTYYIGMYIDYANVVTEDNETDNNDCYFSTPTVVVGCTDVNAHDYNASANFDNNNCQTCTDGIQNGDETGIDCGGATCGPCCPNLLTVTTNPVPNNTYVADDVLDSGSTVVAGSNVIFRAGNVVRLTTGFKADQYFKAYLQGCP